MRQPEKRSNYMDIDTLLSQNKRIKEQNEKLQKRLNRLETENLKLKNKGNRKFENDLFKTSFLKSISHEIRTPMNGIIGFTSLLANPDLSNSDRQAYIDFVSESSNQMLTKFSNLMKMSMIDTGEVSLNNAPININGELGDLFAQFRSKAMAKGLSLSFHNDLPDSNANIFTDRDKLSETLSILIDNAIKYTDAGHIEYGYLKINNMLEFYVKDTGVGIPKEKQKTIFKHSLQTDVMETGTIKENRLGLSLAKAFVELLGGKINVVSEKNKGSRFYFSIPNSTYHEEGNLDNNFIG